MNGIPIITREQFENTLNPYIKEIEEKDKKIKALTEQLSDNSLWISNATEELIRKDKQLAISNKALELAVNNMFDDGCYKCLVSCDKDDSIQCGSQICIKENLIAYKQQAESELKGE